MNSFSEVAEYIIMESINLLNRPDSNIGRDADTMVIGLYWWLEETSRPSQMIEIIAGDEGCFRLALSRMMPHNRRQMRWRSEAVIIPEGEYEWVGRQITWTNAYVEMTNFRSVADRLYEVASL